MKVLIILGVVFFVIYLCSSNETKDYLIAMLFVFGMSCLAENISVGWTDKNHAYFLCFTVGVGLLLGYFLSTKTRKYFLKRKILSLSTRVSRDEFDRLRSEAKNDNAWCEHKFFYYSYTNELIKELKETKKMNECRHHSVINCFVFINEKSWAIQLLKISKEK